MIIVHLIMNVGTIDVLITSFKKIVVGLGLSHKLVRGGW